MKVVIEWRADDGADGVILFKRTYQLDAAVLDVADIEAITGAIVDVDARLRPRSREIVNVCPLPDILEAWRQRRGTGL